jgi:CheY-like chemotaxis protein
MLTLTLPIADADHLPLESRETRADTLAVMLASRRAAPSVERAQEDGSLALVVDDHPTNRAVLLHQVRALGYAAESASNGAEAVASWNSGRFGIIITDCNMPEMNGYDLARHIRRMEADGDRHVPIIACTANALEGEAQKCLAAGMDDYLCKPIQIDALMKVLDRWLPVPGSASMPLDPLDRSALTKLVGEQPALQLEILGDYRRATDQDAAALRQAVAGADGAAVARMAHRLKGASRTVGAHALAAICGAIEGAGHALDWPTVDAAMPRFEAEWRRLKSNLDAS